MTRVLVVDDERAAVDGLRVLLRADGYEVVALQSSEAALVVLAKERFDIVITDLEMPMVHGVEVVRAARRSRADMPVVVVTAYNDSPAATAALAAGARKVMCKPIDYDALSSELAVATAGRA